MITKEDVEHIAKLARLELSDEEAEKFQKELAEVLEYFEVLAELDVSSVEPTTHSVLLQNVKRRDTAKPNVLGQPGPLVEMAADTQGKFVKVKSIL